MAQSKSISMLLTISTIANMAGLKQLGAGISTLSNQVNFAKTNLLKLGGAFGAVALGFKGIQGIGNFMKGMQTEARAAIAAEEKLAVALQKRGAAMNVKDIPAATQQLYKLAEGMEKVGLTSATSLKEGFAGLVAAGFSPDSINKMKEGFEGVLVATQGIGASEEAVRGLVGQLRGMIGVKGRIPADWKQKGLVNDKDIAAYSKLKTETQRAAWVQGILAKQSGRVKELLGTTGAQVWQSEQAWRSLQETLGKVFVNTQKTFTIAMGTIAKALGPVAERLAALMTPAMESFAKWIEEQTPNIEWFGQVIDELAEGIIGVFAGTHEINWDWLTGGIDKAFKDFDLVKLHETFRENMLKGFHQALQGLTQLGTWINDAVRQVNWQDVGSQIGKLLISALKGAADLAYLIADWISTTDWSHLVYTVGDTVANLIIGVVSGLGIAIGEAIKWEEHVQPKLQELITEIGTWPGKIGAGLVMIKDVFLKAFQDAFNAVLSAGSGFVQALINAIMGKIRGIPVIGGMLADALGFEKKQLGGLVANPTLAMLGEKGPEVVVPMQRTQRNVGILGQAARGLGMGGMIGGGGGMNVNVSIPISVGSVASGHEQEMGREIARALQDPIKVMLDQLRAARDEERRTAYV